MRGTHNTLCSLERRKNVSKIYKIGMPNATNGNGANDPTAICAMWNTHFESLLNNISTGANMQNVKECAQNTDYFCYGNILLITPCMVKNTINKLKSGKACGTDGLSAHHFIHSDRRITILLSIFYNRVIFHGHLPDDFMKTIIIPLIKNKSGDTSNVNNSNCACHRCLKNIRNYIAGNVDTIS